MVDKPEEKNILLFIADGLGLYLGCYGTKGIKTPHIDQLAREGTLFIKAFASTASCSGRRSTIYTGLHTHENGQYGLAHGWNHFQTREHIETLPQIFNSLGYQTSIIGKSCNVKWQGERAGIVFDKANITDRPFHLTVAFPNPHRTDSRGGFGNDLEEVPKADLQVPKYSCDDVDVQSYMTDVSELQEELVQYYESISRIDLGVSLVLEELRQRGIDKNTLVIMVGDNGGPFVNSKTTLYDAGVRLPLIIRSLVATEGVMNPNSVSFLDIIPTCITWAGANDSDIKTSNTGKSPPRRGDSILPILEANEASPPDR